MWIGVIVRFVRQIENENNNRKIWWDYERGSSLTNVLVLIGSTEAILNWFDASYKSIIQRQSVKTSTGFFYLCVEHFHLIIISY